ncbi:MAG: hypothetical protein HFG34_11015 [Eubacterium sp.]|nr:hypothetical protein [Eubacterium sp.]
MNLHGRKMVAPVVIAVLFVIYYTGLAVVLALISSISVLVKGLLIFVPLALAGVMIGVTVSRIKEIRSGEEDDLSQY